VRSTDGRRARDPGRVNRREVEAPGEAGKLVDDADAIVDEVLSPGRWPQEKTVDRFLKGDRLERVLSLYERAIRLDPAEPAYPWNLASTLDRLGLSNLALGHMARAIQVAEETRDDEWARADAHLALAEIALRAGETDLALTALASALDSDPEDPGVRSTASSLLEGITKATGTPRPHLALAARLERLPA
jgi:tetratricopeptide (TPR) repeat protein